MRMPNTTVDSMYACRVRVGDMKRTALFLKPEQFAKLAALSKKTGAPIAELIRRAIDAYLKGKK